MTTTGDPTILTALTVLVSAWSAFVISYFLSKAMAGGKVLPDHPSQRSSHAVTTPRSGGIAIFGGWIISALLFEGLLRIAGIRTEAAPLMLCATLIFLVGLADDRFSISATAKLVGQALVSCLFVAFYGGLDAAPLPLAGVVDLGLFGPVLTVFWLVAFMNAFNFMDGVNGIAGLTGAAAAVALAVVAASVGETAWATFSLLLGLAIAGFIPKNFKAGGLFMGDSGSQTISFLLAALGLLAARSSNGAVSHIFLPVAMTPFLFDAGFTLLHRIRRRRNIFSAHCEHTYQLLVKFGWSHETVATLYLALTTLCVGLAILTMSFGATWQWAASAAIAIAAAAPANAIYRAADRYGYLEDSSPRTIDGRPARPDEDGDLEPAVAQAAE